jgi:hypothetical protein
VTVRRLSRLGEITDSSVRPPDGYCVRWNATSEECEFRLHEEGGSGGPHATTHQNNGTDEINVAGLSGLLADPQTPAAHNHDGDIAAAITAHKGESDPHPTYTTAAEASAAASAAVSAHEGAADPHPTYTTAAEAAAAASSAVATHEAAGNPHPTYTTDAEVATAISAHAGAADPHAGYQKESEKGQANGYASLDGSSTVPVAQIPALSYLATSAFSGLAKISVGTSPPANPGVGDLWIETT